MKFPYGLSNFQKVVSEGYFYVDRTAYLRTLEETGDLFLFLRPRRFGKSLWLSTLENYYDIAKADQFEPLFGALAIGQNPTPLHNSYLIMRWDFSGIRTSGPLEKIEYALNSHINNAIKGFAVYYQQYLTHPIEIDPTYALSSFESAMIAARQSGLKLYLLIDEYDNFANEILMAGGEIGRQRYRDLVEGEGLFKTVFKTVKIALSGQSIDRIFITGVSPIVLSDVSSGFNVSGNIYLWPTFNDLCGFTEQEVATALRMVGQQRNLSEAQVAEALLVMRSFYNGYSFCHDLPATIYNPTLALYFLRNLQELNNYPRQMLDSNLAMDRVKLNYIAQLPNGEALVLAALQEDPPVAIQQLADRFGVEEMLQAEHDTTFMASLLYYFGVLTLSNDYTPEGKAILHIPNQVARKLYAERLQEAFLPSVRDREDGQRAAEQVYQRGDLQPLCDFMEQRYFKVFDNRDYLATNELTIKTAFLTLLFNDTFFLMDSEPALHRRYGDLLMIIRPEMRRFQLLDVLIEFEYVNLDEIKTRGKQVKSLAADALKALPPVKKKLEEARRQLRDYRAILQTKYNNTLRLHTYAVVALGFERLIWEEVVE